MLTRVLWVGLLLLLLVTPTFIINQQPSLILVETKPAPPVVTSTIIAQETEPRILYLTQYLEKRGSPLANNAVDFVEAADTYGFDWTLLPSIAGLESSYGRYVPKASKNPFGWGHNNGRYMHFRTWGEAITTVARGLRENYIQKGPVVPRAIGRMYAESPTWTVRVESIQAELINDYKRYERYEETHFPDNKGRAVLQS